MRRIKLQQSVTVIIKGSSPTDSLERDPSLITPVAVRRVDEDDLRVTNESRNQFVFDLRNRFAFKIMRTAQTHRAENKTENKKKDKPKVSALGVVAQRDGLEGGGGRDIRQIVKVNWIG